MIRRPPRSTQGVSSAASDVYKRQLEDSDAVLVRGVQEDGRRALTYRQCRRFIEGCDLRVWGVAQGTRVCFVAANGPEAAVAFLTFSLFCTYAPLNAKLTEAEVEFEQKE